jgi:tellurite methyltransferase
MTNSDIERWNSRYEIEGEEWLERQPRQLLRDFTHLLPRRGVALDAASGVANNGLLLAKYGLHVIAMDFSETALKLAMQRAKHSNLPLQAVVYDLSMAWFPDHYFDVILNFRFLERATFQAYRRSLKVGGLLFFETFVKTDRNIPNPDYYLEPGELLNAFQDFEVLHWEEGVKLDSTRSVAHLVARKPAAYAG